MHWRACCNPVSNHSSARITASSAPVLPISSQYVRLGQLLFVASTRWENRTEQQGLAWFSVAGLSGLCLPSFTWSKLCTMLYKGCQGVDGGGFAPPAVSRCACVFDARYPSAGQSASFVHGNALYHHVSGRGGGTMPGTAKHLAARAQSEHARDCPTAGQSDGRSGKCGRTKNVFKHQQPPPSREAGACAAASTAVAPHEFGHSSRRPQAGCGTARQPHLSHGFCSSCSSRLSSHKSSSTHASSAMTPSGSMAAMACTCARRGQGGPPQEGAAEQLRQQPPWWQRQQQWQLQL